MGALDEELDRLGLRQFLDGSMPEVGLGQRERWDGEDVLAAHVQRFPARHQLRQLGAVTEQLCHGGRRHRHLLEVVEQQQHLLRSDLPLEIVEQRPIGPFPEADRSGGDREDGLEVACCRQVDEVDAIFEVVER